MGMLIEIEKAKEVKKHTSAVHSSAKLTLIQRKISNALLYHAFDKLLSQDEYSISVSDICHLIGYSGNNHDVIKDSLKGLISTVIEWNVLDEQTGQEDWTASSYLASVRIKGPICTYSYSSHMRKLLASPSMYAKINLYVQSKFHSTYGLALYENCVRYKGLTVTRWFDIEQFRKLMGVPSDTYSAFCDFKKRVLDKAVEEVNAHSDIIIEPELNKVGKKVSRIRFSLKERVRKSRIGHQAHQNINVSANLETEGAIRNTLKNEFDMPAFQAEKILSSYHIDYIVEKINYVRKTQVYKNKTGAIAAYLMAAIKQDYKDTSKEVSEAKSKNEKSFNLKSEDVYKFESVVKKQMKQIRDELPAEVRKNIEESFEKRIKNSTLSNVYLENKFDNPLVQAAFDDFCLKHPAISKQLLSLKEFLNSNRTDE